MSRKPYTAASTKSSNLIPDPRAPGAIEVSSHNILVGTVVRHDDGHFAFNDRGILLGEFPNFAEALRAFREVAFDEVMS